MSSYVYCTYIVVFALCFVFCINVSLSRDLFCLHLVGEGGPLAVDEVGKRIRLQNLYKVHPTSIRYRFQLFS